MYENLLHTKYSGFTVLSCSIQYLSERFSPSACLFAKFSTAFRFRVFVVWLAILATVPLFVTSSYLSLFFFFFFSF